MTELPTIHEALAKAKAAVGNVSKAQRNAQQGFNFRGVDDVVNAVAGPLNDNGVIVTPWVDSYVSETVEVGRNKTLMAHIMGEVVYTFTGPRGDEVKAKVLAEAMDSGDKCTPKFMSVAYRIALLQVLNLPTDSPDPDSVVYERSSNVQQEAPKSTHTKQSGTAASSLGSGPKPGAPASAEPATQDDIEKFVTMILNAKNSDQLNKAWTAIGAKGALQTEIERDGTKITLEKFLFQRNDHLKSGSGS